MKQERKILFVVSNDKLLAALTDGDIRRYIIKHGKLEGVVKDAANYSPISLKQENINKSKEIFLKVQNTCDSYSK